MEHIHKKIAEFTKVEYSVEHNHRCRKMPTRYIPLDGAPTTSLQPLIVDRHPLDNVCGTHKILRELWIVSRYYMYFSDTVDEDLEFDVTSKQYQRRKCLFEKLKNLHRFVNREWKRAVQQVPHVCDCDEVDGNHELLSMSATKRRMPDISFDEEFLEGNSLAILKNRIAQLSLPASASDTSSVDVRSNIEVDSYPKCFSLGPRNVPCEWCGAFCFATETRRNCCKRGAVWVPPMKRQPEEIKAVFEPRFRKYLIASNAAFSMASISCNIRPAAPNGIQSVKVQGLMSFHPSALQPNDPNRPRYANFIVLEHGNEEVARMRFETLLKKVSTLLPVFEGIQDWISENNALYHQFKNMMELQKEAMADLSMTDADIGQLQFRIVSTSELSDADVRALKEHKGVYANPDRIKGGDYISVAFTWNTVDYNILPQGLTIHPKNPLCGNQLPISVFEEYCDTMCYPLLFPYGEGGWKLNKYPRFTGNGKKPSFAHRMSQFIKELKENNEDPALYIENYVDDDEEYANDDDMLASNDDPMDIYDEDDVTVNDGDGDDVDVDDADDNDESDNEQDPLNLDNEEILRHGDLEDLQEVAESEEVGQMPNIKSVEINGQLYPMIDPAQRMIDIPLRSDNVFGDENDDEAAVAEPRASGDRDEIHEFDDDDWDAQIVECEDDVDDVANIVERRMEDRVIPRGEDMELADEHLIRNAEEADEEREADDAFEQVLYGDEYSAERTALAKTNGGKCVQNLGKRQFVSLTEYASFVMREREGIPSRFQGEAGPLGQLKVINWATQVMEQRMMALQQHRAEFARSTTTSKVFDYFGRQLQKEFGPRKQLGMLVTMPSTVPGSSKYQRELVMSAVTVANKLGNPDLFITFTGSPRWQEIQDECKRRKCNWGDIPEFVCSVFKYKFDEFLKDVVGEKKKCSAHNGKYIRTAGMFGHVNWFNYSVEFQQRGMPHVHMLIALRDRILTTQQVDDIVTAEVPDLPDGSDPLFDDKMRYYNLVKDLMTHTPCEGDLDAYCNKDKKPNWKKCTKDFPKPLTDHTALNDNEYARYKRTARNHFRIYRRSDKRSVRAGSEYVVSHNKELLIKYACHVNVEIVSSIRTIKYMFKYIHKGSDRVLLEASETRVPGSAGDRMTLHGNVFAPANMNPGKVRQRQNEANRMMDDAAVRNDRGRVALNDCTSMIDMNAMTACEAAWRHNQYPMHGASHTVHRGYIHEETNKVIYFKRGVSAAQLIDQGAESKGMLEAWFEANRKPQRLPDGRLSSELTLPEMFSYFKFETKAQKFVLRKKDYSARIFGRIQAPQPRWLELTATRLLAQTVAGPRNWEALRTYDGITYSTCLEAAQARRLMNGEVEWDDVIQEVGRYSSPVEVRRVFASILVHCAPANPAELWNANWNLLVNSGGNWSNEQRTAHALRHIGYLLARHGMQLINFELADLYNEEDVPLRADDTDSPNAGQKEPSEYKTLGEEMYRKLNQRQKEVVDRAIAMSEESNKARMMFVDGPGGTGKTFCYKTLYNMMSALNKKVVCVAHTGIAAALLPNGCTAHRMFAIPLEVSDLMTCNVDVADGRGEQLRSIDCVIWDEACMTDRRIFDCVSTLFKDLRQNDLPFGGVQLIMGGDWRQILPIVAGVQAEGVVDYILKNSEMWDDVEKFWLTENQRAKEDPAYAATILTIGDGLQYSSAKRKMVAISENHVVRGKDTDLIREIFPDVNHLENTKTAAILTVDNRTALRLNNDILALVDGEQRVFLSEDQADSNAGLAGTDPAVFASQTPQGMPPHKLTLRVGAQIVLLRNISVEHGLCNGTRLTIKEFGRDVLICVANNLDTSRIFYQ